MTTSSTKQTKKRERLPPSFPPSAWPDWLHYLVFLCVFLAGVTVGFLWLLAPWSVVALAVLVLVTVLVLKFKK